MNSVIPAILTSSAILAAGLLFLRYQHAEIELCREAAARPPSTATVRQVRAASSLTGPHSKKTSSPAGTTPASEARAGKFMGSLQQKMRPLAEQSERDAVLEHAKYEAQRVALLLGLNDADRDAFRTFMEKHAASQPGSAEREWIAARSAEAAAKFDAAEAATRAANIEHDAQEAIYRVSRVVDLTPDQKDRLFTAFSAAASARQDNAEPAPAEFRTAVTITDWPTIEDPATVAREILTPEQMALYEARCAFEKKSAAEMMPRIMTTIMPAIYGALREASAEGNAN